MKFVNLLIISVSLLGIAPTAHAQAVNPMIHAEGTRIVDGDGNPIRLRGVLLEGWLMWNGSVWGAGFASETTIASRIERLVGRAKTESFRTAVYEHFITERDIEMIAELGLNVVRVPINHAVLEDDGRPIDYTSPGWAYFDRLLDWCDKHSVYVVPDLHATPGGQSGLFVADPELPLMWESEAKIQRTVDLWVAFAARYRDRQIIAGYDLINEPDPPSGDALVAVYRRLIEGIRSVDPNHMVILEGSGPASTNFSFYKAPLDDNQVYSFHTYNLLADGIGALPLERLAQMAEQQDVPLWNGEFGAHTDLWTAQEIGLFEDPAHHVNGWVFWPWKRVPENPPDRFQHLMEIVPSENWNTVREVLASLFGNGDVEPTRARGALDEFIEASKAENLIPNARMVEVIQLGRAWKETNILTVKATDNIYGSGLEAPAGGGSLPRSFHFSAAPGQTLTFSNVIGTVAPSGFLAANCADGGPFLTHLNSTGLLSGIKADSSLFLAGVFLGPDDSVPPVATTLDFTSAGIGRSFQVLAPEIGQVFFIGDGREPINQEDCVIQVGKQQRFHVPPTATRLFLGFADGALGPPGLYDDNSRALTVVFEMTGEPSIAIDRSVDGVLSVTYTGVLQVSSDLVEWRALSPQPPSPFALGGTHEETFFRSVRLE